MIRLRRRFDMAGGVWREQPKARTGIRSLALFICAAGLGYWFFSDTHSEPPVVSLAMAVRNDVPVYANSLGTVQAYNSVTVHTQADGQLKEVLFKEGQDVHTGDVLAKLDPHLYQAQYDQAIANKAQDEAQLEAIRHSLAKHDNIAKKHSLALDNERNAIRQFEAALKSDQAAIDNAKAMLGYTVITSPINGRIGMRQVDAGNMVHTGDTNGLAVITQMQPIAVIFNLPQQTLPGIGDTPDTKIKLKVLAMDADNHRVLDTGELELADNQIEKSTGTVRLKAIFPNVKRLLWPGAFINVRILLSTRTNSIVVPSAAVLHGPQNAYVFVYKSENASIAVRPVKIALVQDQNTVIEEGVKENEQVVVDGMAKLQDGVHVRLAQAKTVP